MKLENLLKTIRKETGSTTVADSPLLGPIEYYSTGSLALNRVISGDIYGGIPRGRITTIYGDSQSGKSLIAAQTAALALENKQIDHVFFVDSEGGGTGILENMGVDMDKVEYIPVNSIETCTVQMLKLYDAFIKMRAEHLKDPTKNEDIKVMVILDSWGGLTADKLINDATVKGTQVQDMGLSAKLKNNLIASLMMRTIQSGVSLIVINHTYENPGAMFASKIKPLPGGKKLEFSSHVILQSTKLLIKSADEKFLTGNESENAADTEGAFFKGNKMNFFCTKNRLVKPCFSANVYIDFDSGISKYDGLIDDAITYGFIEKVYGGYKVPSYKDSRVYYRDLVNSDEIWNTFIDEFNEESKRRMAFSKTIVDEIEESEKALGVINDMIDADDEEAMTFFDQLPAELDNGITIN